MADANAGTGADPAGISVIVTGGARGLGRAMTLSLLRHGVNVAVADLPVSAAEIADLKSIAASEKLQDRLHALDCDVTDFAGAESAVNQTIQRFGGVDVLVNNAGVGMQGFGNVLAGGRKRFFELDADAWRHAIDVNVNVLAYALTH